MRGSFAFRNSCCSFVDPSSVNVSKQSNWTQIQYQLTIPPHTERWIRCRKIWNSFINRWKWFLSIFSIHCMMRDIKALLALGKMNRWWYIIKFVYEYNNESTSVNCVCKALSRVRKFWKYTKGFNHRYGPGNTTVLSKLLT